MKLKKLIGGLILSSVLAAGVGVSISSQNSRSASRVEAVDNTPVTKLILSDSVGWNFRTLWLESFSFSDGYTINDLRDFIKSYYVNDITTWNKEGSTKGYHEYNNNFNLCAGGTSKTYTFLFPTWVTTCKVTVENNSNSRYMNYLDNLYLYSNNTSGGYATGGIGKTITITCNDWGNASSVGSAATEASFNTTVNLILKTNASTTISTQSLSISKYDTLKTYLPSFGYTFDKFYSNANLTTATNTNLPLNLTTVYGKLVAKTEAYVAGTMNDWNASDPNYLMEPGENSQYRITKAFTANTEFKIVYQGSNWYGWSQADQTSKVVTNGSIIQGTDPDSTGYRIKVAVAGTYEIYLKTTEGTNKLWIQQDSTSEATTYATAFLAAITCTSDSTTFNINVWNQVSGTSSMEYKYNDLTEGAKGILATASANQGGTLIEQCAARYDRILSKYGFGTAAGQYHDFMNRKPAKSGSGAILINSIVNGSTGSMIAIIAISSVSIAAIGGYFLFKKKKND